MRTTKPAAILLALVLLTAAAVQPAEAMVKPKISNTRTASCLVKITFDPAVLPLSDIVIDYLLHSSGVAGKAAREVLNISPDDAFQLFTIEDVAKYSAGGIGIPPEPTPTGGYRIPAFPAASKIVRKPKPTPRPLIAYEGYYEGYTEEEPTTTPRPLIAYEGYYEGYTEEEPTTTPRPRPTTRRTTPAASPASAAEQTFLLKLQVGLGEEVLEVVIKPAAEEFMNALIENLRRALSDAFDDHLKKLDSQRILADEEAFRAENKLVQMQKQLRNISGYRNLSRSVILNNISGLRSSIQSTEMRKASDQIEMESTAKEIADTEVKIRDKLNNDRIMVELEKIVRIHQEQKMSLARKGTPPENAEAGEKLARAKIELAKRRQEISKAEGGNRVSQLSSKLAQYTQRMAQYELSLSNTKEQLKEAMDFLDRADDYELLLLKADIAKQSLTETLLWREQMDRKARLVQPPAVTVLGGS